MIFWKYGDHPIFVSGDMEGDQIYLSFGLDYVDDIQISGENFVVYLVKDEMGWQAKIDKKTSFGIIHDGMINQLIAEINNALKEGNDFDIVKYVMSNKEKDAYFSHIVRWRKKR